MKQIVVFFFVVFILLGVISCKKDESIPSDMGYSYFPTEVGSYVVYDVDSFYYNNFTKQIDTFKFQLKEKIESTFSDNQNRTTFRLERFVRNYDSKIAYSAIPWKLRDVWVENRTTTTAEKVEENVRYIKLAFPLKLSQTWDGNAQNALGKLNYSFDFFDQARTISGVKFDSVLQVNQQNVETQISKKYCIEKYAQHTGLVYKQVISVESQPDPTFDSGQLQTFFATPIMFRVTSGIQYSYTYNSSGNE